MKEVHKDGSILYQCEECDLFYKEEVWAQKCEAWCREHQSCNLDIIGHAIDAQ